MWLTVLECPGSLLNQRQGQGRAAHAELDRWESLVRHGDLPGPHRVLTRLDRLEHAMAPLPVIQHSRAGLLGVQPGDNSIRIWSLSSRMYVRSSWAHPSGSR